MPALAATAAPAGRVGPQLSGHLRRLLGLGALILLAYSNCFHGALVFDNAAVIGQDPRIRQATAQNVRAILEGHYWYVNKDAGLYRPLTTLSYLVNYAVLGNGLDPAGYHAINLALHAINIVLVYALGILIFGRPAPAWALSAIWGLHPVLTESVTNIVGRADLLATFGVLTGLLCHLKGAAANGRSRLAWLAGLAAAQAIGLFSKESAAVLPGLMLLYDLTWVDRASWRRRARAYAVLVLPFAAFFLLRGGLESHMLVDFTENPLVKAGFWTARLTAIRIIGKYLCLFFWPAHLSADYSYNQLPLFDGLSLNWEDAKALLVVLVSVGASMLAMFPAARRYAGRPLLFFVGFFFIALSPTSNLFTLIGTIMAERFLYLPSIGLAGCCVAIACTLETRPILKGSLAHAPVWAALGLICAGLTARTYARNSDWRDSLSLWTSAVSVSPASARAHYNLGRELEQIPGGLPKAIAEYQAALRIQPGHADAHNNLGNALARIPGRLPEAIVHYEAALRIRPDHADAHNNLGNALARIPGRLPEAISEYEAALRIEPDHPKAHANLANALARTPGRLPEAIAEYQAALRIDPNYAEAHNNLANLLARIPGRLREAIGEYEAALRIEPDRAEGHYDLGNALAQIPGRLPEAIAEYRAALRNARDFAEAHVNMGNAFAQIPGRLPEAIEEYRAALRTEPDLAEAHFNLGNALTQMPSGLSEAITEYEFALRLKPDPQVRQMLDRLRVEERYRGARSFQKSEK